MAVCLDKGEWKVLLDAYQAERPSQQLPRADKLRLMQFLGVELAQEEGISLWLYMCFKVLAWLTSSIPGKGHNHSGQASISWPFPGMLDVSQANTLESI